MRSLAVCIVAFIGAVRAARRMHTQQDHLEARLAHLNGDNDDASATQDYYGELEYNKTFGQVSVLLESYKSGTAACSHLNTPACCCQTTTAKYCTGTAENGKPRFFYEGVRPAEKASFYSHTCAPMGLCCSSSDDQFCPVDLSTYRGNISPDVHIMDGSGTKSMANVFVKVTWLGQSIQTPYAQDGGEGTYSWNSAFKMSPRAWTPSNRKSIDLAVYQSPGNAPANTGLKYSAACSNGGEELYKILVSRSGRNSVASHAWQHVLPWTQAASNDGLDVKVMQKGRLVKSCHTCMEMFIKTGENTGKHAKVYVKVHIDGELQQTDYITNKGGEITWNANLGFSKTRSLTPKIDIEVKKKGSVYGATSLGKLSFQADDALFPEADNIVKNIPGFGELKFRLSWGQERLLGSVTVPVYDTFPHGDLQTKETFGNCGHIKLSLDWDVPRLLGQSQLTIAGDGLVTGSVAGFGKINISVSAKYDTTKDEIHDKSLCMARTATDMKNSLLQRTSPENPEESLDAFLAMLESEAPIQTKLPDDTPAFLNVLAHKPNQQMGDKAKFMSRDYTLIIDRSGSMGISDSIHVPMKTAEIMGKQSGTQQLTRWEQVSGALRYLAPYVVNEDPDGIGVYFFDSKWDEAANVCSESDVIRLFNQNRPGGGTYLGEVLKEAMQPDTVGRAETIFVLTDGQASDPDRVARNIIEYTKKMCRPEMLSVSFIQVGSDRGAQDYLNSLDDALESRGAKFDIVDAMTVDEMQGKSFLDVIELSVYD